MVDEIVLEDSCNTVLVLRLGGAGEGGHCQRSGRGSSMKSEPSAFNPLVSGLSLTLGLSDTSGRHSSIAEVEHSASFSNVKEVEAGSEETEKISARGSDDEEEGGSRKKLRLTKEQSALLEERFKEHSTLNPKQKLALSKQLNLRPRQVEVWFQNRRARTKLKQTEVDCEFLRRCCETLTEENRKLNRELQELKSIKMAAMATPHYMQLPPAVLKVCPSCERVAGGGGDRSKGSAFTPAKTAATSSNTLFWNSFTNSTAC